MEPLLDEKDRELEEALLEAGRDVELSPAVRAKLLATLGVSASLALTGKATAANAVMGKLLGAKSTLLVVATTVTAGVIGGVYLGSGRADGETQEPEVVVVGSPDSRPAHHKPVAQQPPMLRPQPKPEAGARAVPEAGLTQVPEAPGQPLDPASERDATLAQRASKPASKLSAPKDALRDELVLVEAASHATKAGSAAQALERLAEYRRRFPRGKLALEAEALRIEALALGGQKLEAARLAQAFLKRHPESPIALRVRRYAD